MACCSGRTARSSPSAPITPRSPTCGPRAFPAAAVRAYLDELGLPRHDVSLDLSRIHRLAIDAIAEMPDADLAAAADAPPELARALRGARTLVEARQIARQILAPEPVELGEDARLTLERFVGLRGPTADVLDEAGCTRDRARAQGGRRQPQAPATGAHRGRARA